MKDERVLLDYITMEQAFQLLLPVRQLLLFHPLPHL